MKRKSIYLTICTIGLLVCFHFTSCNVDFHYHGGGSNVMLSGCSNILQVGDILTLQATIHPATDKIIWISTNTAVATVANGRVTALSAGTTDIIAVAATGGGSDICRVEVIPFTNPTPVDSVVLNTNNTFMTVGTTITLTATVYPYTAHQTVIWSSSNLAIADVNALGTVTSGDIAGTTTITATTRCGLHSASCTIRVEIPLQQLRGCNSAIPRWGNTSLGDISFDERGHGILIQGTGQNAHIRQIWSGAVTATACQKDDFSGGTAGDFNADCRSNLGFPGDLFSWCAVMRFADVLCPYPWRVPTAQDVINLDMALGGNGANGQREAGFVANHYTGITGLLFWGGDFGGWVDYRGQFDNSGTVGRYWSQSDLNHPAEGIRLGFTIGNWVEPRGTGNKGFGHTLRCIR